LQVLDLFGDVDVAAAGGAAIVFGDVDVVELAGSENGIDGCEGLFSSMLAWKVSYMVPKFG
jgi:hypothetical protein